MPQQIDVPGMGIVEFPDGMSDQDISAAIQKNMQPAKVTLSDIAKSAWNDVRKFGGQIGSAVSLPFDVAAGKAQLPGENVPGSVPFESPQGQQSLGRVQTLASLVTPMVPRAVPGLIGGPPTTEALRTAATAGYEKARNMGVDVKPTVVKDMADQAVKGLEDSGVNAKLAPKTFSILSELQSPPEGAVATIANLETVRRTLGNAAKDFNNPTEQLAAKRAIESLDSRLANLSQGDVLAGDATQAAQTLGQARGNYAAAKRAEQISNATESADLGAAAANSGRNIGNQERQKFKSILLSDKQSAGFNEPELAQIERIVRGTGTGNTARFLGNLLGGGGGLGQLGGIYAGAMFGGPAGAVAAPTIGNLARALSNASTNRQVRLLDEMVRSRSPLAEGSETTALTGPQQARRAAIIRALMATQQPQQ